MAQYKYSNYLTQSNDAKYDSEFSPGTTASNPGIYRCTSCGDEIGIAKGHTLPPQNQHQHSSGASVKWKLIVMAQQK